MHIPVLLDPLQEFLKKALKSSSQKKLIAVDATFGAGGYTKCLLENFPNIQKLYAIDRDPLAFSIASNFAHSQFPHRLIPILGAFSQIRTLLPKEEEEKINLFLFDIGLSSMQIADVQRGFSFWNQSPLDMRMNAGAGGTNNFTAFDVVNGASKEHLGEIFQKYGEEEFAFSIANAIVKARNNLGQIKDSKTLAEIILSALPSHRKNKDWKKEVHPARKVFQALRIVVNDELEELKKGLLAAHELLDSNGILSITTFHSLECQIVKEFFHTHSTEYSSFTKSAILPKSQEIAQNSRSRSARLRIGIKK